MAHRQINDPDKIAKAVELKNYFMDDDYPFGHALALEQLRPGTLKAQDGWSNAIYHRILWGQGELGGPRSTLSRALEFLGIHTVWAIQVDAKSHEYGYLHEVDSDSESLYDFSWENSVTENFLYTTPERSLAAHSSWGGYTVISAKRGVLEKALGHSVYRNWMEFRQGCFCGEPWFKYEDLILGYLDEKRTIYEWGRQYEFT